MYVCVFLLLRESLQCGLATSYTISKVLVHHKLGALLGHLNGCLASISVFFVISF